MTVGSQNVFHSREKTLRSLLRLHRKVSNRALQSKVVKNVCLCRRSRLPVQEPPLLNLKPFFKWRQRKSASDLHTASVSSRLWKHLCSCGFMTSMNLWVFPKRGFMQSQMKWNEELGLGWAAPLWRGVATASPPPLVLLIYSDPVFDVSA